MNNDFFSHSWGDLPMIFTRDFVTRENHWQITSLGTQKSLFTVTHALFFISFTLLILHSLHDGCRLFVSLVDTECISTNTVIFVALLLYDWFSQRESYSHVYLNLLPNDFYSFILSSCLYRILICRSYIHIHILWYVYELYCFIWWDLI